MGDDALEKYSPTTNGEFSPLDLSRSITDPVRRGSLSLPAGLPSVSLLSRAHAFMTAHELVDRGTWHYFLESLYNLMKGLVVRLPVLSV